MKSRLITYLFAWLTVFTISIAAAAGLSAQAASSEAKASVSLPATSFFHVAPEKGYFDYRSNVPLVEQFIKRWNAKRRS